MPQSVLTTTQLRQCLTVLYFHKERQHRPAGSPEHAARTRLYADVFTDVIARESKQDVSGSLAEMFWIPQCVALYGLGSLTLPNSLSELSSNGLALLDRVETRWGRRPFSKPLRDIVGSFQENWSGGVHPHHLAQTAIPLAARIARIVETYTQTVPLATPATRTLHFNAINHLYGDRGQRFDPELVELFAGTSERLLRISERPMQHPVGVPQDCYALGALTRRIRVPLKRRFSSHAVSRSQWTPVAIPNRGAHANLPQ